MAVVVMVVEGILGGCCHVPVCRICCAGGGWKWVVLTVCGGVDCSVVATMSGGFWLGCPEGSAVWMAGTNHIHFPVVWVQSDPSSVLDWQ